MESGIRVRNMRKGDGIEGFYLLRAASIKTTAAGKPFLTATLEDRTGAIDAVLWDYHGDVTGGDAGKPVLARGTASVYKGGLQLTLDRLRLAEAQDRYDEADLVPTAPIDAEAAYQWVLGLVESLEDGDYRLLCRAMLQRCGEALRRIPAAKSIHHGFVGGLLMHTANMLQLADFAAGIYGDTVNRSLLLAGVLLHDLAKREEFTFSPLGLVTDYAVKGQLIGHLVLGAQAVAALAAELGLPEEKSVLLQHLILSHHGEPEHGAAVRPLCAEAELLSMLDMLDSRMEIYREALAATPPGTFCERVFALDKKLYKPGL